jgi:hypothetical protein
VGSKGREAEEEDEEEEEREEEIRLSGIRKSTGDGRDKLRSSLSSL